jgi:ribosomal protein L29
MNIKQELEEKIEALKAELAKLEEQLELQDVPELVTSNVCVSCEG